MPNSMVFELHSYSISDGILNVKTLRGEFNIKLEDIKSFSIKDAILPLINPSLIGGILIAVGLFVALVLHVIWLSPIYLSIYEGEIQVMIWILGGLFSIVTIFIGTDILIYGHNINLKRFDLYKRIGSVFFLLTIIALIYLIIYPIIGFVILNIILGVLVLNKIKIDKVLFIESTNVTYPLVGERDKLTDLFDSLSKNITEEEG